MSMNSTFKQKGELTLNGHVHSIPATFTHTVLQDWGLVGATELSANLQQNANRCTDVKEVT